MASIGLNVANKNRFVAVDWDNWWHGLDLISLTRTDLLLLIGTIGGMVWGIRRVSIAFTD